MFGNDLDTSKSKHTDLGVHMLQSQEGQYLLWEAGIFVNIKLYLTLAPVQNVLNIIRSKTPAQMYPSLKKLPPS